jgi:hypothetical protein
VKSYAYVLRRNNMPQFEYSKKQSHVYVIFPVDAEHDVILILTGNEW